MGLEVRKEWNFRNLPFNRGLSHINFFTRKKRNWKKVQLIDENRTTSFASNFLVKLNKTIFSFD